LTDSSENEFDCHGDKKEYYVGVKKSQLGEPTVIETQVLIVGGGPAGLSMALFLARYGVDALLVTRHRWTANSPRAHITNQRTVEIFRDMGIEQRVVDKSMPSTLMGQTIWATSLAGRELARLGSWGNHIDRKGDYERASPSVMCNIAQHLLEPILAESAMSNGARLRFHTSFLSLQQDAEGVTVSLEDRDTGLPFKIRAQYVVGADGARSRVAEQIDLPLGGSMGLGAAANVWIKADLTKYTAYRPGVLYSLTQPGTDYSVGSGTFICVRPWTEWVMLFMYNPKESEPNLQPDAIRTRAHRLIGDESVAIEVLATSKWTINQVIARRYSKGRVFCVGDAVHRHPPANGLGSNTSVQDSYNLAWKLKLVLQGSAHPSLLDTYNDERQPVGAQVVDRAMRSLHNLVAIADALGFAQGQNVADGWAAVDELSAPSTVGAARRKRLAEAIDLQHWQFNALGIEIGQRYRIGAISPDGTAEPPYLRDPELYDQPTTWPGARLPHVWLEIKGAKFSTHDLVGKGRFSLLIGVGGEDWFRAANSVGERFGINITVFQIGSTNGVADPSGDWARLREIDDFGCVLVRPDAHIGWRSLSAAKEPIAALASAVATILGRGSYVAANTGPR